MDRQEIIKWLLDGDIAIQYQVYRDLMSTEQKDLRKRIANEGWGLKILSKRKPDGHWGKKFYQPKWTSTHYTLLDLRNLCLDPGDPAAKDAVELILRNEKGKEGGILPIGKEQKYDVCVNGMFLNYAAYFHTLEEHLKSVIDFILSQQMSDGGFNCRYNRSGARHSSLHSTLSVLEGITEYELNGYKHRLKEVKKVRKEAAEFILMHRLFLSDRTGEIINKDFLKLKYPYRWKYDILRALDYFQYSGTGWDERMRPAMEILLNKRNKNGTWNTQAKHPGKVHFDMEQSGKPGRWNTLRAMRVLKHFNIDSAQ
jgi:hypothetical protein